MTKLFLFVLGLLSAQQITCDQQISLDLIHTPEAIRWTPSSDDAISWSSIADLLSLSLGYTVPQHGPKLSSLAIDDVFALPKASVTFRVHSSLVRPITRVAISEFSSEDFHVFDILSQRTQNRFSRDQHVSARVDDGRISHISGHTLFGQFVNRSLEGANAVDDILDSLSRLKSLEAEHWPIRGVFWLEATPGDEDVEQRIEKWTQRFRHLYDDDVIVTAVEGPPAPPSTLALMREKRQTSTPWGPLNLAHRFDPHFHTAFATIGFTCLLLALTVFGVSVALWHVDPDRDSIIYRMTAQRMKKEQ